MDALVTLHEGDCLEVLAALPDASIDAVVTDPPYSLAFMGRSWDTFKPSEFQAWCEKWATECLRVLRPGGYLLAFGGTRTYHRLACGIEDAGFEVRDSLHWIYGQGFPKGKAALKPSHEPIVMARKPDRKSAPLPGLDACRVEHGADVDQTAVQRQQNRHDGDANWRMRPGHEQPMYAPAGRWPPNVLLTHSADCQPAGMRRGSRIDKAAAVLPDDRSAYGSGLNGARPARGHGDADGMETVEAWDCAPGCPVAELDRQSGDRRSAYPGNPDAAAAYADTQVQREPGSCYGLRQPGNGMSYADSGGASRFFPVFRYQAKASSKERPRLPDGTAWPTVKPLALMRWLVRLVTPPGGTVLDPFAGTGTTAQAAALEGFSCVLAEKDPVAVALIRQRLAVPLQPSLLE